jgi:hypothetical protein
LFVVTRVALTALGIFLHGLGHLPLAPLDSFTDIWNVWDGKLYLDIARYGYSAMPLNGMGMANYAFFPLYPLLIRLVEPLVGNYAVAGLLVSNLCLLVACVYIYRYVALDSDADARTAARAAKYLILFPMAFLFSAVLTESLFLALSVACLYYARRGSWIMAGVLGFFVPLTRLPGLAILVPLVYEYLRQHNNGPATRSWSGVRARLKPELIALLMPLIGFGIWVAFNNYLTGDVLGFIRVQATWGGHFTLPPVELLIRLLPTRPYVLTGAIFTIAAIALMVWFYKKVDFGGWLFGALLICIPLFSTQSGYSMLRYLAVVFPLCIIAAKLAKDRRIDIALTIALVILQAILMAFWTLWTPLIV